MPLTVIRKVDNPDPYPSCPGLVTRCDGRRRGPAGASGLPVAQDGSFREPGADYWGIQVGYAAGLNRQTKKRLLGMFAGGIQVYRCVGGEKASGCDGDEQANDEDKSRHAGKTDLRTLTM